MVFTRASKSRMTRLQLITAFIPDTKEVENQAHELFGREEWSTYCFVMPDERKALTWFDRLY